MKLNHKALREGDIVFMSSFLPIGWVTRIATKSNITHAGILVDAFCTGDLYIAEMKETFRKNDIKITPTSKYTRAVPILNKIVSIKRSPVYSDDIRRLHLRKRIITWKHLATVEYDWGENFALTFGLDDPNSSKFNCSHFVYAITIADGIEWPELSTVSPKDLYEQSKDIIYEVDGWKGR